jgi:hypothetical protein
MEPRAVLTTETGCPPRPGTLRGAARVALRAIGPPAPDCGDQLHEDGGQPPSPYHRDADHKPGLMPLRIVVFILRRIHRSPGKCQGTSLLVQSH